MIKHDLIHIPFAFTNIARPNIFDINANLLIIIHYHRSQIHMQVHFNQ